MWEKIYHAYINHQKAEAAVLSEQIHIEDVYNTG